MKPIFASTIFAVAVIALLSPRWSTVNAQQSSPGDGSSGLTTVGAWFGNVDLQPGVGFPFLGHFNADGTWTAEDTRGFGTIPLPFPFTAKATAMNGAWTRSGPHSYTWAGTQVLLDETLPGCSHAVPCYFVLVTRGSHDVLPGDPDHMTNGHAAAKIWPCGTSAFTCPSADTVLSDRSGFGDTFTFTLTRVRAN